MKKLVLTLIALTPALAFATPGPYATLQAGVNTVNTQNIFQTSTTGFAGGAAAGYLWGTNTINYGLEADALVYPNSKSSKNIGAGHDLQSLYDGYNLSLLAVLKFTPYSTGFTAFVKAGGAYVNQQLTNTIFGLTVATQSASTFAPEAAAGIGYIFTPNLELNVTWDHVFADDETTADTLVGKVDAVKNDNFLLGLTYHFA
jgi:outer membrane immunogenic protein